ncbi:MAG: hypothetical protein HY902_05695 [Deltaproteobacteria bacterium]|nr:hypothetical protein [Deltaproteobacteria bacterium]
MMQVRWVLTLSIAVIGLGACKGPCEEVAERACSRTGERDGLCMQLRQVAASPTDRDAEQCRAGKVFLDQLEKN